MDSEGNGRCLIADRYIEETSSCRDSYDGLLLCYESGPIPPDCSAISFLQGIISRAGIEDISIEGLIRRGLLIRMGNNILVTNAFEMLTSNRGGPVIKCALFPDDTAIEFLDHAVYDGSILDQIEDACRFVRRNVRCAGVVRGLYRTDTSDVPMDAVREAIVNAVVHRDYLLFGMDVFVSVFPDRVVAIAWFPVRLHRRDEGQGGLQEESGSVFVPVRIGCYRIIRLRLQGDVRSL